MKYLRIIIILFLFIFYPDMKSSAAEAAQNDEISKLHQKITELETRIKEMETELARYEGQGKPPDQSGDGWQNKKNWRKLKTGMNTEEVLSILGEPIKTINGVKTLWYYPDTYRSYVSFDDKGRLTGWHEP